MLHRLPLVGTAVVLTFILGHSGRADPYRFTSFQGRTPPELIGKSAHWINSKKALTLKDLRGRPVWLQFNF